MLRNAPHVCGGNRQSGTPQLQIAPSIPTNTVHRSLQNKTGWWYTYPYESVSWDDEILKIQVWKKKSHVPNHHADIISYHSHSAMVYQITIAMV